MSKSVTRDSLLSFLLQEVHQMSPRKKMPDGERMQLFKYTDWNIIADYVDRISFGSEDLTRFLFIVDLDGTLTNTSHGRVERIRPRVDSSLSAPDYVTLLHSRGAHVVISSAWDNFDETEEKIKLLDLGDFLSESSHSTEIVGPDAYCSVSRSGRVVSVRDTSLDDRYYRQKALSYRFTDPAIPWETLQHVLFIDDSNTNIRHFQADVQRFNLFPQASITLFLLKEPKVDHSDTSQS
jgi:hypothetical protein